MVMSGRGEARARAIRCLLSNMARFPQQQLETKLQDKRTNGQMDPLSLGWSRVALLRQASLQGRLCAVQRRGRRGELQLKLCFGKARFVSTHSYCSVVLSPSVHPDLDRNSEGHPGSNPLDSTGPSSFSKHGKKRKI